MHLYNVAQYLCITMSWIIPVNAVFKATLLDPYNPSSTVKVTADGLHNLRAALKKIVHCGLNDSDIIQIFAFLKKPLSWEHNNS